MPSSPAHCALLLCATLVLGCSSGGQASTVPACEAPSTSLKFPGASLTVAEVEANSLEEMKGSPHAPQVPFGFQNKKWEELKAKLRPGDQLLKYDAEFHGGHALVRGGCVVMLLTEWMI